MYKIVIIAIIIYILLKMDLNHFQNQRLILLKKIKIV